MAAAQKFTIEVSSSYPEFWRYNVALMCGCFDVDDVRHDFASAEQTIAPVGSNLTARPAEYPAKRVMRLETPATDHLLLYIYVVPHTLPTGNDISATKPFNLHLRVTAGDSEVLASDYRINQWSGTSIELRVPSIK